MLPIAENWPGFLWIHDDSIIQLSDGYFGKNIAANISVWDSIGSLEGFMKCTEHDHAVNKQDLWFEPMQQESFVLWWVHQSHEPTFQEACERLEWIQNNGPTPDAFNLVTRFEAPDSYC